MSQAHAENAAFPLESRIADTADFPEWLGPLLIKELRQGLRSGLFLWAFRVLPILLAVQVVWVLSNGSIDRAREASAAFFWMAVIIPSAVLGPMRALGGIRSEREALTLELLQLTPLSSWRIVFAKWSSLMAQVLLWVASLLPFFVLRYFFGRMDLITETAFLAQTLLVTGLVTAVALAISTLPKVVFWLSIGGLLFLMATSGFGLANVFFRPSRILGSTPMDGALHLVLGGVFLHGTLLFLSWTASRIAPPAENHAVRMRLGLLATAVWPILGYTLIGPANENWGPFIAIGMVLLWVHTVYELTLDIPLQAAHLRPWRRWGAIGRMARAFVLPGWPSALLFGGTVLSIACVPLYISTNQELMAVLFVASMVIAMIVPRTCVSLFAPGGVARTNTLWLIHIGSLLAGIIVMVFRPVLNLGTLVLAAVVPTALPWLCTTAERWAISSAMEISLIILAWAALAIVAGLWRSRPYRLRMRELDTAAKTAADKRTA